MIGFFKNKEIDNGIRKFKATNGAVLLDVRSVDEYRYGHIPQSINIDVDDISTADKIIDDKDTPIFVYCLSGGRSSIAVRTLKNMGYQNVNNIGGISTYDGELEKGA